MSRLPYQIFVHLPEARNLPGLSDNKMSSPYAEIRIGPNSHLLRRTETKHDTISPVWEAKFLFEDVMLTEEEFRKEKLVISVYDRNELTRNGLIGSHEFSLTNIQRQKGSQYHRKWFPMVLPDQPGYARGHLLVTTFVLRPGAEMPATGTTDSADSSEVLITDPQLQQRSPHLLNVLIYRGHHILENSTLPVGGARNPFVVVRFNGNTAETPHADNTGAPVWNQRISLPFSAPLTSESIELQLWNRIGNRPAQLIGEVTLNYFNQSLAHRAWGPRWVNFYSSEYESRQVTTLGGLKTLLDSSSRASPARNEYVGRALVRMSVLPTDRHQQRLAITQCNPVALPPTVEYCLDLLLYTAAEVPVMGGQLQVEVCFGDKRAQSSRKLGKDGVFSWMETMTPVRAKLDKVPDADDPMRLSLRVHGPADLSQLHDVVISVYHVVGGSVRKVAFLRLPPTTLIPQARLDTYFVNGMFAVPRRGMISERLLTQLWSPRWWALHHAQPDPDAPHLVAGFLQLAVGFGLVPMRPSVVPRPIARAQSQFTLRAYIYHGQNLPATDSDTLACNPFMVLRCGEASYRTRTLNKTTSPFWCEWADLGPLTMDKANPPSIFLQVFHQTQMQHRLLGRTDILGMHALHNTTGKLFKYQLYYDPAETAEGDTDGDGQADDARVPFDPEKGPYVLMCLQLIPFVRSRPQRYSRYPLKNDWVPEEDAEAQENSGSDMGAEGGTDAGNDEQDDETLELITAGAQASTGSTKSYVSDPSLVYWRPRLAEFICKLELVGLRDLTSPLLEPDSVVRLEATLPLLDGLARAWRHRVPEAQRVLTYSRAGLSVLDCAAAQLMAGPEWPAVRIPLDAPHAVSLRVRVWVSTATGEELLCSGMMPLVQGRLVDLGSVDVVTPEFYTYKGYYDRTAVAEEQSGDVDEEQEQEQEQAFSESDDDNVAEVTAKLDLTHLGITSEPKRGVDAEDGDESDVEEEQEQEDEAGRGDKDGKQPRSKAPVDRYGNPVIGDDGDDANNVHTDGAATVDPRAIALRMGNGVGLNAGGTASPDDDLDEGQQQAPPHTLALMSGHQSGATGASEALLQLMPETQWRQTGLLRYYFTSRLAPSTMAAPSAIRARGEDALEEWRARQLLQRQRVAQEVRDVDHTSSLTERVYSERFVTRVYVYEARHLTPRSSLLNDQQTADPYLVVRNGQDDFATMNSRANARLNTLSPRFLQVFELQTELPRHHRLEIAVWHKASVLGDSEIGRAVVDVEERVMSRRSHGASEWLPITRTGSATAQGQVLVKVEVLSESEARRVRAEDLIAAEEQEYELRMVLWSTREVRMPEEHEKDQDVDQKIYVTTNFTGEYGEDDVRSTDIAWYSANGSAEWNWRFVWRLKLPCQVPRIKMSIWDENLIEEAEAIGELNYNLHPLLQQALRDRKPVTHQPQAWIPFAHPNYPGVLMGEALVEMWMLPAQDAAHAPVGEAQDQPNQDPFLPEPARRPPPWAVGSRALGWLGRRKMLMLLAAIVVVVVPVVILVVYYTQKK